MNLTIVDTFDQALRLIGIGVILMTVLVIVRSEATRAIRHGTVLLQVGVIGYLVLPGGTLQAPGFPGRVLLVEAATLAPLALWLFAHSLFERQPDWRLAIGAAAALILCDLGRSIWQAPWLDRVGHGLMTLLVIDAVRIALVSRADDLNEKRRRFSLVFVAAVAVETLIVVLGEIWYGTGLEPGWLRLAEAVTVVATGLIFGGTLLSTDLALLGPPPATAQRRADTDFSPAERVLRDRLHTVMAEGAWYQPGLTIGDLATRLGVPEHRLRALINQRLGYRNFSAFLNTHRIAEAKVRLADPDRVALPVLTIAMDLGYGSLAPFNRAFRETTGQSPTDFRRAAFADAEES